MDLAGDLLREIKFVGRVIDPPLDFGSLSGFLGWDGGNGSSARGLMNSSFSLALFLKPGI
jgi:hypothetical protein